MVNRLATALFVKMATNDKNLATTSYVSQSGKQCFEWSAEFMISFSV